MTYRSDPHKLKQPILVFDLETTSANAQTARICQMAFIRIGAPDADGNRVEEARIHSLVNPGVPIEPGAVAVHGITDADVADKPGFGQWAQQIMEMAEGAVLAGFNVKRFDLIVLDRELKDCGHTLNADDRPVFDALTVFLKHNPRDLAAAVRMYLGRELEGAHDALADTAATAEVVMAQLLQHPDIPGTASDLAEYQWPRDPSWVDGTGRIVWKDGRACIGFGSRAGQSLEQLVLRDSGYLRWILTQDFPADTKHIVGEALQKRFPRHDP